MISVFSERFFNRLRPKKKRKSILFSIFHSCAYTHVLTRARQAEDRDLPPRRGGGSAGSLHRRGRGPPAVRERAKLANCQNLQIFANFWRSRSRLYQNEILQENMRVTAFFKLYKICIFLHRRNLKILLKVSS